MCNKRSPVGLIVAALGFGLIIMSIFPTKIVIVLAAFALMLCGIFLYKKC